MVYAGRDDGVRFTGNAVALGRDSHSVDAVEMSLTMPPARTAAKSPHPIRFAKDSLTCFMYPNRITHDETSGMVEATTHSSPP